MNWPSSFFLKVPLLVMAAPPRMAFPAATGVSCVLLRLHWGEYPWGPVPGPYHLMLSLLWCPHSEKTLGLGVSRRGSSPGGVREGVQEKDRLNQVPAET